MSFWNGVNKDAVNNAPNGFKEFKIGENHACISKVEEKVSESGSPMLEITFANEEGTTIRYFIVDGEWKLSKLKQLYQAFGIPMGETNTQKWIGHWGCVVCKAGEPYNGKVYNKVSYVKPDSDNRQEPGNHYPENQRYEPQHAPADDGFTDDIPF